jgi:uncharacterized protein (TIGR00369 family)
MSLNDYLQHARSAEDLQPLIDSIPYARFLGFSLQRDGDDVIGRLAENKGLVGNFTVDAIHGGVISALLELTAMCQLMTVAEIVRVPKIVNFTVDYLRMAQTGELFARAVVTRHGRRLANVQATAYQRDPSKPVAVANLHFLLAS